MSDVMRGAPDRNLFKKAGEITNCAHSEAHGAINGISGNLNRTALCY
jgi:hypothetical protein